MVVLPSSFPRQGCADSAPLRWRGRVACAVCPRGAVATLLECTESSLRQWRHGGGGCMFAAACLRLCERCGVEPGESLHRHSCLVVVVAAPLGRRSSRWGQHYRAPRPEVWSLGVKTRSSLLDGDGGAIGVASSLGASLRRLVSASVSIGGGLDGPYAVEDEMRKVNVLAARCRGAMGAGELELACMVLRCFSMTAGRR